MMVDIIQFMSILSLFVIGFSQSFFTLLYNIEEFKNPAESFISTFDIILGGLEFNSLVENSEYKITVLYIYRVYIIVSVIILLNMLIAILESSYNKIIERANKEWHLERSKLILSLMNNIMYKNLKH